MASATLEAATDFEGATGSTLRTSPLLRRAKFTHGFTTRPGGQESVRDVGLEWERVYLVTQVHGSAVVVAHGAPAAMKEERADALILHGHDAGGVRVADCVPVLVGDPRSGRAAAIHAGWRGVVSGVIPSALAALGASPATLVAAIGPCIEACCFEVGADVAATIHDAVPAPLVVARHEDDKAWVDLVVAVRAQLEACGVPSDHIERVGGCTKCDVTYESYRRDGAASGRMLAFIQAHEGAKAA